MNVFSPRKYFFLLILALLLFIIFVTRTKPTPFIVGLVLPHDNTVKELRGTFLKHFADKKQPPNTIVLLSPDHFSVNQKQISYTDRTWRLSNGEVYFDHEIGDQIVTGYHHDDSRLGHDHGIFNVLPDLKAFFPQARIIPILLGQQLRFTDLTQLADTLNTSCLPPTCLIVSSVDFSHYLPATLANIHDKRSLLALQSLQLEQPKQIEVDSPQSLFLLIQHARALQANSFQLFAHTNSSELAGRPDQEGTSHIFGWYQQSQSTPNNTDQHTFLFATQLIPEDEQTGLGERFFYGVDQIETQLNKPVELAPNLTISPNTGKITSFHLDQDNKLNISLAEDVVIAGVKTAQQTTITFLPVKADNTQHILLRGDTKRQRIQQLFKSLPASTSLRLNPETDSLSWYY